MLFVTVIVSHCWEAILCLWHNKPSIRVCFLHHFHAKQIYSNAELGLTSTLSVAVVINNPYRKLKGHTTFSLPNDSMTILQLAEIARIN